MSRSKVRSFVKKDIKRNVIVLSVVVFMAVMIVAVISLLSNRMPDLGDIRSNGAGRGFMFPFVFISESDVLAVMADDYRIKEIDDSVNNAVHDITRNEVIYTRENVLYTYSISKNSRVKLVENVRSFRVLDDKSAILCIGDDNIFKLYRYKNKQTVSLNETMLVNTDIRDMYRLGNSCILFMDKYNPDTQTADLMYSDFEGNLKLIASAINAKQNIFLSSDDKLISYYDADGLKLVRQNGELFEMFGNAIILTDSQSSEIVTPSTTIIKSSDNIKMNYILETVTSDEGVTSRRLLYCDGSGVSAVHERINSIVYYDEDEELLLYSIYNIESGKIDIYRTTGSQSGERVLECDAACNFIFSEGQNYLYYQDSKGLLSRVNIYDYKLKNEKVADNTSSLYNYPNKSLIAYSDATQSNLYYIMPDNTIERLNYTGERRFYGKSNSIYILSRVNELGKLTIDYVESGNMTRINSDASANIFFDKDFINILYLSAGSLYVWHDGVSVEISSYTNIKAVSLIE